MLNPAPIIAARLAAHPGVLALVHRLAMTQPMSHYKVTMTIDPLPNSATNIVIDNDNRTIFISLPSR